jgi:hypothetical protein
MEKLKVGDKVLLSEDFGKDSNLEAKVLKIEETIKPKQKWGVEVNEVDWNDNKNFVVIIDRDEWQNYKWAYGYQIRPVS